MPPSHSFLTVFLASSLTLCVHLSAQQTDAAPIPESPIAQPLIDQIEAASFITQQPTQSPAATQSGNQQSSSEADQRKKAEEQVKEEERQRVLGVLPSFNVVYRKDVVSLTPAQKISLAFHTTTDPVTIGSAFVVAGYHEVIGDDNGFRWGPEGYGRRVGAAYLDIINGTMIGNGFLPALLHQEPRYLRRGYGTFPHRVLYALSTNFICQHDNTHKWEPNYSNVLGNIASGALSNLYYPSSNSGIGLTITNGLVQTVLGGIGSTFQEFWPDISRKFLHQDPTHGLDAQNRAQHP